MLHIAQELLPLVIAAGLLAWATALGALLPFVLGSTAASFMCILVVFNTGLNIPGTSQVPRQCELMR